MKYDIAIDGVSGEYGVAVLERSATHARLAITEQNGSTRELSVALHREGDVWYVRDGVHSQYLSLHAEGDQFRIAINGKDILARGVSQESKLLGSLLGTGGKKEQTLKAKMPGKVVAVLVEEGQTIAEGDGLVILEAMKMENRITAGFPTTIARILVKAGDSVDSGQELLQFA